MRTFIRSTLPSSTAIFGGMMLLATGASAQPAPARKPPPPAAAPAGAAPAPAPAGAARPGTTAGAPVTAPTERIPTELTEFSPSGLTADQVGQRAALTSYQAKASEETLNSAAAKVDAAWAAFLPRITGTARYTRLSDFTLAPLAAFNAVGTTQAPDAPGTVPRPVDPASTYSVPFNFSFPLILNQYYLQANITVPISDYFLKVNQNYTAATHAETAARFDVATARAKSSADGRTTFYNWLRARNAVVVAVLALQDQKNHLTDASNQFQVGNASRADVLRAETNVAAAELQVEQSKNLADLTEKQIRVAIHAKDEEKIVPGEGLEGVPDPVQGNIKGFTDEALASRFEVKSIDANAEAARRQAKALRASRYPTVSAFANGYYANPNPRAIPQSDNWKGTWDVGAQLVWTPTDIPAASANASDAEARAASLQAQKQVTRDGIEVEVMQAWNQVKEADFSLESTKRQLASATEAYRVARELFNAGRGTSTTLTDAETELTRARLAELNSKVDARIARVKLEHAIGRDTKNVKIQ